MIRLEASMIAIDQSTGGVRVLVGGRDFTKNSFNWATRVKALCKIFVFVALGIDAKPRGSEFIFLFFYWQGLSLSRYIILSSCLPHGFSRRNVCT